VVAKVARVRFASEAVAREAADQVTVRALTGADAEAAGDAYTRRHIAAVPTPTPTPAAPEPAPAPTTPPEPFEREDASDEDATTRTHPGNRDARARARGADDVPTGVVRLARDVVAEALAQVAEPVNRGWLVRRTGLSRATVMRSLNELEAERRAERVAGQKWQAVL